MRRRTAGAALATALLLAGCGGTDARGELRDTVADITAEANNGDADGVRRSVDVLLGQVSQAVADGQLTPEEAGNLERIALAVQQRADLIDSELIEQAEAEAERQRLEAERKAAEEAAERAEAERQRLEEEQRKAAEEEEKKRLEEEQKRLEEEQKQQEEQEQQLEEEQEEVEEQLDPSPSSTPAAAPTP